MKAKRLVWLVLVLGTLVAQEANAFYNPTTGRWLNRDPLGEFGFETVRGGLWDLLGDGPAHYGFLNNDPIARTDILGTVCLDPCGLAKAMGLDRLGLPEGAEPDASGVICCGGKKYTCVWRPGGQTGATNKKAQELISKCLSQHEDNHHDDVVCPDCSFWPTRERFKIPVDPRRAECAAYTVHLKCLQNAFASNACGGDTECNRQLLREIVETSRKKNDYCSE